MASSTSATGKAFCTGTSDAPSATTRLFGQLIAQRYPYTLRLTLASLFVAIILSIPAGVRSARRRNRWDDRLLSVVSLFGLSFPNFALGPILILLFAIKLGWLQYSGAGSFANLGICLR